MESPWKADAYHTEAGICTEGNRVGRPEGGSEVGISPRLRPGRCGVNIAIIEAPGPGYAAVASFMQVTARLHTRCAVSSLSLIPPFGWPGCWPGG